MDVLICLMARATDAQKAKRLNSARSLLHGPASLPEAAERLAQSLLHLQTPSLSLSRAGAATPTSGSGRRCQSLLYRQAFAPFGRKTPDVCHFHRLDLERDRQSSLAGGAASWGRPWLTTRQVGNERSIWNINLIGYGRTNWRRLINAWCPTMSGSPSGQLPRRPETTRGF